MNNFKDIEFPENSNTENVLESVGVPGNTHNELFTKFLTLAKGQDKKSQVVKSLMLDSYSDDEMKLIFLLAYDKAITIIQETAEKVFKK